MDGFSAPFSWRSPSNDKSQTCSRELRLVPTQVVRGKIWYEVGGFQMRLQRYGFANTIACSLSWNGPRVPCNESFQRSNYTEEIGLFSGRHGKEYVADPR